MLMFQFMAFSQIQKKSSYLAKAWFFNEIRRSETLHEPPKSNSTRLYSNTLTMVTIYGSQKTEIPVAEVQVLAQKHTALQLDVAYHFRLFTQIKVLITCS